LWKIRQENDAEALRAVFEYWQREQLGTERFGFDVQVDSVIAELQTLIDVVGAVVFVLEDRKGIAGLLAVFVTDSPYGDQKTAFEKYWFVRPKARRHGLRLLKHAKQWAVGNGCSHFVMTASNMASDMHDKTCRVYERLGFKLFETSYIKEL